MRYYKRITNGIDYKQGVIYPEDYKAKELSSVGVCAGIFIDDYKEVPEIDYLLQVAKNKYKDDPTVICVHDPSDVSIIKSDSIYIGSGHIWCFAEAVDLVLYDGDTKQWAEIVEEKKTITDYENDTMMDKPMTHQEAIEELRNLLSIKNDDLNTAVNLAIKNMEENKPKVLSKNEWLAFKFNGTMVLAKDLNFENIDIEYTQYLNDNK
jgi:hypothetical protein